MGIPLKQSTVSCAKHLTSRTIIVTDPQRSAPPRNMRGCKQSFVTSVDNLSAVPRPASDAVGELTYYSDKSTTATIRLLTLLAITSYGSRNRCLPPVYTPITESMVRWPSVDVCHLLTSCTTTDHERGPVPNVTVRPSSRSALSALIHYKHRFLMVFGVFSGRPTGMPKKRGDL